LPKFALNNFLLYDFSYKKEFVMSINPTGEGASSPLNPLRQSSTDPVRRVSQRVFGGQGAQPMTNIAREALGLGLEKLAAEDKETRAAIAASPEKTEVKQAAITLLDTINKFVASLKTLNIRMGSSLARSLALVCGLLADMHNSIRRIMSLPQQGENLYTKSREVWLTTATNLDRLEKRVRSDSEEELMTAAIGFAYDTTKQ
jgi:hypothetical protein